MYVFILRHYNIGLTDQDIHGKFEGVEKVMDAKSCLKMQMFYNGGRQYG